MGHRPFTDPLHLLLGSGEIFIANSAWDALEFLTHHWCGERARSYQVAVRACRDAIDGFIGPAYARRATAKAAKEAGCLATPMKRAA